MAARTKQLIVDEARAIAACFGISVASGEHAGAALGKDAAGNQIAPEVTWQQAMIRLQLLQIELLSNIRQSENAP